MSTKERICMAAQRVLRDHEAGRSIDPMTLAWARFTVKVNAPRPEQPKEPA